MTLSFIAKANCKQSTSIGHDAPTTAPINNH